MRLSSRPPRVYADTTVFGGIVDSEFAKASRRFFEEVQEGRFVLVTSALVQREIRRAPLEVQELLDRLSAVAEVIDVNDAAFGLRRAYVDANFVRSKSHADALHVALATVSNCTLIVSWNFRDIVNFRKIPLYNAINTLHGYGPISIYSPLEVIQNDREEI